MEKTRLTQHSHGAGCGCKIAPADLEAILNCAGVSSVSFPNLLVGNGNNDDAAVMDMGNGTSIISTTDFFTPIVDTPHDFGQIASANAISDVYAMGGRPLMAVAILGWPVELLGAEMAGEVIAGAREICHQAGIPLAGGHSIDSKEPFFGLAVTGEVLTEHLKRNSGAQPGDALYLTKPVGTGILSTAMKRGIASEAHIAVLIDELKKLNSIGAELGSISGVHAMTDVTGFGLLGHLVEMCEASKVGAALTYAAVPTFPESILKPYLDQFVMPDNTMRNFKAFGSKSNKLSAVQLQILCDPQTNGGLLIAVDPDCTTQLETILEENELPVAQIGSVTDQTAEQLIQII